MPQVPWPKRATGSALHIIGYASQSLSSNIAGLCRLQVFSPALLDRWDQETPSTAGRAAVFPFPCLVEERGATPGLSSFFQAGFLVARGWATLSLGYEWILCLGVVEELPVLALLCGQLAPTHLSARAVLGYPAPRCSYQPLWPDGVRQHSPQWVGLWLGFFHGCRQTRL